MKTLTNFSDVMGEDGVVYIHRANYTNATTMKGFESEQDFHLQAEEYLKNGLFLSNPKSDQGLGYTAYQVHKECGQSPLQRMGIYAVDMESSLQQQIGKIFKKNTSVLHGRDIALVFKIPKNEDKTNSFETVEIDGKTFLHPKYIVCVLGKENEIHAALVKNNPEFYAYKEREQQDYYDEDEEEMGL